MVAGLLRPEDLIVGARARQRRELEAVADADALHGLDRHDGLGQPTIQLLVPRDVRAEPRDQPERAHLVHAAERLVGLPGRVDLRDHRLARAGVEAANGRLVDADEVGRLEVVAPRRLHRSDRQDVAEDAHAERPEEHLRQRTAGHPRGGLARARALQHVAHVREAELLDPRQVRVTGARQVHLVHLGRDLPGVHALLPVGVVAVRYLHRHRAAERTSVPDPGGHLGAVRLDLHAPPAPVSELPPRQVAIDVLRPQLEPRGQALEHRCEARAVRLTGCREAQRHRRQP